MKEAIPEGGVSLGIEDKGREVNYLLTSLLPFLLPLPEGAYDNL